MIKTIFLTELSVLFNEELIALIAYAFLYLTYYFCSDFSFVK